MSNAPVLQGHARHSNSHTLLSQQKTATRVGNSLTLISRHDRQQQRGQMAQANLLWF